MNFVHVANGKQQHVLACSLSQILAQFPFALGSSINELLPGLYTTHMVQVQVISQTVLKFSNIFCLVVWKC